VHLLLDRFAAGELRRFSAWDRDTDDAETPLHA